DDTVCRFGCSFMFFFFQAEDGIRAATVTGVQTCALPISAHSPALTGDVAPLAPGPGPAQVGRLRSTPANGPAAAPGRVPRPRPRSEERRVGKECRSRSSHGSCENREYGRVHLTNADSAM